MGKKILLALDESKNSMKTIRYVAETFSSDDKIVILSVFPDIASVCKLDSPALTPVFKKGQQAFCDLEEAKVFAVKDFMEGAKKDLVKAGFRSKNIKVKTRKRKQGIARDILKEARQGKYNTIVIGRRGLSGVKKFLFGSVSNKVVQLAEKIPVIVVD